MATTPNLGLETIERSDKANSSMLEKMNNNFNKIDTAYKELSDDLLAQTGEETIAEAIQNVSKLVNAQDGTITADKVFNGYVGYAGKEKIVGTALSVETDLKESWHLLSGQKLYNSNGELKEGTLPNKNNYAWNALSGSVSGTNYRMQIPELGCYNTSSYLTRSKANVISDLGIKVMPTISVSLSGTNSTLNGYIAGYGAGIDANGVLVIWAMSNTTSYEHISFVNTSIGAGTVGNGWKVTTFDTGGTSYTPFACTVTGLGSYSTITVKLNATGTNTSNDFVNINVTLTAS